MLKFNSYSSKNISNEISYFVSNQDQLTKSKHSSICLSTDDQKYLDHIISSSIPPLSSDLIQEHSSYQSLLQLKDNEIGNLKSILNCKYKSNGTLLREVIKSNDNCELSETENSKDENHKPLIEKKKQRNCKRLNDLKNNNDYLYCKLVSQSLYFKSKINIIKQSSIAIDEHQNAIDALSIVHQKHSIELLDRLIHLKNILNECDRALNTKSSRPSNSKRYINKSNTNLTEQ